MSKDAGTTGNASRCHETEVALVGGGLVGSLLAVFLARRGFQVDLFERRPDMRKETISAGRSINLAISTRGIRALEKAGMDTSVLAQAVQMRGRMIHTKAADGVAGELVFQPYGKDESECINSISRATLNKLLMDKAEASGKVRIHFRQKASDIDFAENILTLEDESCFAPGASGAPVPYKCAADIVIGTDGSASRIREEMMKRDGYGSTTSRLDYGYKELVIPPAPGGGFLMERNALHIWPRGSFMLIALPNFEGSYTCTLFLPFTGPVSFEKLTDKHQVQEFFQKEFPDAVPLIENLTDTFFENPTGHMDTIKSGPWNVDGSALLLGDAAHAVVPFYGQGANCGFEDLTVLDECIDDHLKKGGNLYIDHRVSGETRDGQDSGEGHRRMKEGGSNWKSIFDDLFSRRKVNCDAIADMAVENFTEMRDKVADPRFLMFKAVEKILEKSFPGEYRSRYSLVTFSNAPYKLALDVGIVSDEILGELCRDIKVAEDVDLVKAKALIQAKLAPLLATMPTEKAALAGK